MKLEGKEEVIQRKLNLYNRPSINDKEKIVPINLNNICDLAYLRMAWRRHTRRINNLLQDLDGITPVYETSVFKRYKLTYDVVKETMYLKEWLSQCEYDCKDFNFYAQVYYGNDSWFIGESFITAVEGDFVNMSYTDLEYVIGVITSNNERR